MVHSLFQINYLRLVFLFCSIELPSSSSLVSSNLFISWNKPNSWNGNDIINFILFMILANKGVTSTCIPVPLGFSHEVAHQLLVDDQGPFAVYLPPRETNTIINIINNNHYTLWTFCRRLIDAVDSTLNFQINVI